MAVQTAFVIEATDSEIDLFRRSVVAISGLVGYDDVAADPDVLEAFAHDPEGEEVRSDDGLGGLRQLLSSIGGNALGVELDVDEGSVHVSGMEDAEVHALGETIRRTMPSALPFCFAYSFNDHKPRDGAFGGGIVMIDEHGTSVRNTVDLADQFAKETRRDVPLSDLQNAAVAAYDGDHGDTGVRIDGMGWNAIRRYAFDGGLGDHLALFVIAEVGDAEVGEEGAPGEQAEEAARMMRRAAEQLEDVAVAMDAEADRAVADRSAAS